MNSLWASHPLLKISLLYRGRDWRTSCRSTKRPTDGDLSKEAGEWRGQVARRIAALERPTDAITSVTPRNATSGPLPIPRLRCTLKVDGGIIQVRSSRQGKIVQAGDGFTRLLGTTVCLILIVCLISVAPSTIFHARSPHALQHAATALASDPIPISSANSNGLCFSALPGRAMWHSFLPSGHEKTSTVDAVLAMVQVSPSCQQ